MGETPIQRRRRLGARWGSITFVALVGVSLLLMLWALHIHRAGAGGVRTFVGVIPWVEIPTHQHDVVDVVTGRAPGAGLRPRSFTAVVALTLGILFYLIRVMPRLYRFHRAPDRCVWCNQTIVVAGRTRCPECGKLPGARPRPWVPIDRWPRATVAPRVVRVGLWGASIALLLLVVWSLRTMPPR